jgi:dGTPase
MTPKTIKTNPKMQWKKLLTSQRLGRDDVPTNQYRSDFQRDYDRIVFCPAFRRLQDKTQVFPLASTDFVRTRLTHSIEVSCVARNLGTMIGRRMKKSALLGPEFYASDLGNIAAAASLAHDLGNPPFGHSGEAAIQRWFTESKEAAKFKKKLSPEEQLEFEQYEGNAHAFRLVTRLLSQSNEGGLQLTCATLGALAKYPIAAHKEASEFGKKVSAKKFNFFSSEAELFQAVAAQTGLIRMPGQIKWWCRHPLAFVCEAADDITYRIVDFEDGWKMECYSTDKTIAALEALISDPKKLHHSKSISSEKERVSFLRAVAIAQLGDEASDAFITNIDAIMEGRFEKSLVDVLERKETIDALAAIKKLTEKHVYTDKRVLEVEVAGFEIIYQLLERFAAAALDDFTNHKKRSVLSKKVLGLLPPKAAPTKSHYEVLLRITDFVAGMTDGYAVETFQRISGQKFIT